MLRAISVFALAALPVALAIAAPPPGETGPVYPKHDPSRFVQEPTATPRTGGADTDLATAIAEALNQDADLKHAKITVQPEKDSVLLTGVTLTNAQRQKAGDIAAQRADGRTVINALQTEELYVSQAGMTTQGVPEAQQGATGQSMTTQEPGPGDVPKESEPAEKR